MKHFANLLVSAVALASASANAQLQITIPGPISASLLPFAPTSADTLRISMGDRTCGNGDRVRIGNPYRVSMNNNAITVTLGFLQSFPVPLCPPAPREDIDIGRLPAGNYTISLIADAVPPAQPYVYASNVPFTVTDARASKSSPYVRMDYSGHWWDPNDSGWGLFVWQDAKDNVLAAWFTYGVDGKPIWWVFQPRWQSATATQTAALIQTSRAPGPNSPPQNPTLLTQVGTASLDFTRADLSESGTITYQIGNGPTLTRSIVRFAP